MGAEQILKLSLKVAEEMGGYLSNKLATEALDAGIANAGKRIVAADTVSWEHLSTQHWLPFRSGIGFELKLAAASDGSALIQAATSNQFMGAIKFDPNTRIWAQATELTELPGLTAQPFRRMTGGEWYSVSGQEQRLSFTAFSNKGPIVSVLDRTGDELGRARLDLATRTWSLNSK